MTLLRFVSLALVGTVGSYGLSDFPKTASFNVVGDYTIEHDTAIRHQRSTSVAALIVKGNEAVRIILQGARQLPSDKHTVMMFQKPGNLNSALSDFKRTKPMPVSYGHKTFHLDRRFTTLMTGFMGKRAIGSFGWTSMTQTLANQS